MDVLLSLDTQLFFWINHAPHGPVFDAVGKFFSGIGTAGIVWFVLGIIFYIIGERKHTFFFPPLVITGFVSWLLVEVILKPFIARPRPSLQMGAIIVGQMKPDFSMPSGHATIAWAMAVLLSSIEPKYARLLYTLAFLISLSRIYNGVHYPLDVIAGALLGSVIGLIMKKLRTKVLRLNQ